MRDNFEKLLNKQMKNSEFKKEHGNLEPDLNIVKAITAARKIRHLTQQELSVRTGINQAASSKLETGNGNPTLDRLQRLAIGMGMTLKIEFLQKQTEYEKSWIKS